MPRETVVIKDTEFGRGFKQVTNSEDVMDSYIVADYFLPTDIDLIHKLWKECGNYVNVGLEVFAVIS